ncbi:activating signal cointegrator 1 complex subunit 3-like [Dermatophagoides pteronyssinus]|uniref:activating signal cointegrator 1 complex subunit 3-like n=1 Tax=Dermatophagoides pteronyssinus TaxID=6956 RepID=UPI003F67EE7E
MDNTKNKLFSTYIRQKVKSQKYNPETNKFENIGSSSDRNCDQIYNGCFTRFKLMEQRLTDVLDEKLLPRFENIVEHLRNIQNRSEKFNSRSSFDDRKSKSSLINNGDIEFFSRHNMNTKICSNNERMDIDHDRPIQSPECLYKELLSLIAEFIQVMDRSTHQILVEKAAVYLLWVLYDSFQTEFQTQQPMTDKNQTTLNFANISSHYNDLEYILCLNPIKYNLMEKMYQCCRQIFQVMEPKYLNEIFFYASVIKKVTTDLEKQSSYENYDWYNQFTDRFFAADDVEIKIDPYANSKFNYMLMNKYDKQIIHECTTDFTKFNPDYSNSEFILQNLLYSNLIPHHLQSSGSNYQPKQEVNNIPNENQQKMSSEFQVDMEDSLANKSTEDILAKLYEELTTFIADYNQTNSDKFYLSAEELNQMVMNRLINSDNDNDSLYEELTNLLGEKYFQLVRKLIFVYKPNVQSNNQSINANQPSSSTSKKGNNKNLDEVYRRFNSSRDTGSHSIRPSVVVTTAKEKALKKEMRKIAKKINKVQKNTVDNDEIEPQSDKLSLEDLERMREKNLKASIRSILAPKMAEQLRQYRPVEQYPFVYDLYRSIKTTASYIAETKLLLPIGSERKEFKTHDEVYVPLLASTDETQKFLNNFSRIEIADTDEFIRTGFDGFEKLNIIQSAVFSTAYQSDNQNMLICAPTGAGKTNIAMLAILNILRSFSVDDSVSNIDLAQFKIIYIAPMKALCAEMTSTFGRRLQPFGVKVRELTGDMQMTSKEIMETQMLVVTPEKWDVVTRKSVGDVQLMDLVRLIILDEVHLLQSDRGHVVETIVARTVRYVEQSQKCIRMIGLSATLPNYVDVAQFLHVDLYKGLYVFDDRFRPVPLAKTFIGCKARSKNQLNSDMDEITMKRAREILQKEYQVMIFVHSRNATMAMATYLLEKTQYNDPNDRDGGESLRLMFQADTARLPGSDNLISRARYRNLNKFLLNGIGIHHAGMPRSERNIVEKLFSHGVIKVLVCTSTLAWGVNLPAHSVIIRGTEYYDPSQGSFVDIDMLDVMQIFGRAGRPQFDSDGDATIITTYDRLPHYLSMLTNQLPIESKFLKRLVDNLNAEIVLGTVCNIREIVDWLKYTYLYIRMQRNPLEYGLKSIAAHDLGLIIDHLTSLAKISSEQLDRAHMIRYNPEREGTVDATHLGRIASHFYIQYETIVHFNENLRDVMDIGNIFHLMSSASEFHQLRVREEEIEQLQNLWSKCKFMINGDLTSTDTKINILMQSCINRSITECHSLNSDMMYILQNMSRLTRGLFEYVIRRGWPVLSEKFLDISLMFEKQIWNFDTPLYQFESELTRDVLDKLSFIHQSKNIQHYDLREMDVNEIAQFIHDKRYAPIVKRLAQTIPYVQIEASVKPITRTILTIYIDVKPDFVWDDKYHGKAAQLYWIWLTDMENNHIYHAELGRFIKKQVIKKETQRYIFTIPLLDAAYLQKQYLINCTFEYWMGAKCETEVSCHNLLLPDKHLPHTPLLDLMPLPIKALQNDVFESIYPFSHFNPIQTQIFHTLYHTDNNVLLGAPTGSGKTIAAEIALFRVINTRPWGKIVYIAPLKALVRERVDDWKQKIEKKISLNVVELTGDVTPDLATIDSAQLIVTTPEKWDGVSRGWTFRKFVRQVALIVIDEIHLLGEERGPVLEMIVSRTNFIRRRTGENIRIIGLSTAVANAQDLSSWLDIHNVGLYNFSSSVRPVPIEVHVSGFSGKHYCPRMASMNKPAYRAIKQHSPTKPVIVFVSSRRQTRLTALDLITLVASDDHTMGIPFLHIDNEDELDALLETVKDSYLKHTLRFGIGMHHAGLVENDRKLVEQLFAEQKIQVLITTATLAWGINLPAHAVIIKGTEFFDGKKGRYVDFPITDVLQMIGRAGRPQFDTSAVAILFVHDIKKEYYRKFLYEPFPVESHLLDAFPDHLNAEVITGTVKNKHEAMEFLSSTYLYHRIIKNPSYYGVDLGELSEHQLSDEMVLNTLVIKFLSTYIDQCVQLLIDNYCIRVVDEENQSQEQYGKDDSFVNQFLSPTPLGKIASYYYLSYKTIRLFQDRLCSSDHKTDQPQFTYYKPSEILDLLTMATEYATLPVRHNEELLNAQLAKICPFKMERRSMDSPHTKANLLLQAHCSRSPLPIVDYYTDLKTVLDQVLRIFQAMIDISALNGSLPTTINIINLQQSIIQASWQNSNQLLLLLETDHKSTANEFIDDNLNDASEYYQNRQHQMDAAITDICRLSKEICSLPVLLQFLQQNSYSNKRNDSKLFKAFKDLFEEYSIHPNILSRLFKSLTQLPLINVEKISINKIVDEDMDSESWLPQEILKENTFVSRRDIEWLQLQPSSDYCVCCQLKRISLSSNQNPKSQRAYCPSFPKPKSESWYLILGCEEESELITITRVPCIHPYSTQVNIRFRTPDIRSSKRILYTLYLLSDCYIGLDQQYNIPLQIN